MEGDLKIAGKEEAMPGERRQRDWFGDIERQKEWLHDRLCEYHRDNLIMGGQR